MKFSDDRINFRKIFIFLITVALWEIHYRTYDFEQFPEVDG